MTAPTCFRSHVDRVATSRAMFMKYSSQDARILAMAPSIRFLGSAGIERGILPAMGILRHASVAVALAILVAGGPVHAQKGKPTPPPAPSGLSAPADVETAEQLYAKLDYEQAKVVAKRVTEQSGLTHDQLVRAYRV